MNQIDFIELVYELEEKRNKYENSLDSEIEDDEEIGVKYYKYIENVINNFHPSIINNKIYGYDFKTDQIIPLKDYTIGSKNILTKKETKPYVRKRTR